MCEVGRELRKPCKGVIESLEHFIESDSKRLKFAGPVCGPDALVQVKREDDANGKWKYEVVVRSQGKEWGFEVGPKGKLLKTQK